MAFTYPRSRHIRRHGPRGYRDYRSYKPWLRDEFAFRCVYCLWRERWCADGDQMFSVDHLLPRTTHPGRLCDYDNLVYACCQCNALKQEATPVLNPCEEALGQHREIHSDGSVRALTARGAEQIALCRLNRPRLQEARRMMLELVSMLTASRSEEARALLRELCGFPDNLPHIATLRPPAGNTHPEAIVNSYYAKRQRGDLPATCGAPIPPR
jgi:5-methylcytosine-specific restriction endonuclease McrA